MKQKDFCKSISDSFRFLDHLSFARALVTPVSLSISKDFNKTALSSSASHEDLYFSALKLSHYNILLNDYSFLQFSLSKEGESPELRLCFYPNPMSKAGGEPNDPSIDVAFYEELFRKGELDFEEFSQAISETKIKITTPIIRFDVSHSQFLRVNHPICHLHLGLDNSSRVACNRILNPLTFTMFVIRTFYFDVWDKINNDDFELEKKFRIEKQKLIEISNDGFCDIQQGLLNLV